MSRKVALLIGVSEYGEGIPSLSAPLNDVAAMERVLKNPNMGGFDEVEPLINPDLAAMQKAVQQIFANCHKDDLVLLFFSGHGITDDNNRLYLATKGTSKDFYQATSVPASFIQDRSLESYAKRQVIVLDCCYSGAFAEGWQAKSVGIHLEKELGAEGRVVLTSSTATQTSFQQEDEELSLYTQFLVEGIETGAADKEGNGKIYAHELHDYAKAKVQEVKPKQKPEIIIDKEGFNILLSQAPVDDPELDYRKLVEKYATKGQITVAGNYILQVKRQELDITDERSDEIINEVLAPYRKRIENIKLYQQAFTDAVEQNYPLNERLMNELKDLEDVLGLEDKDIAQVKEQILAEKKAEYQNQQEFQQQKHKDYEHKLQQYKQEFTQAIEAEYPLDKYVRDGLKNYQRTLELTDEDVARIEQPILAQEETKYQEKQKEQEEEEYENKLLQYKDEFSRVIQRTYPLDESVRNGLKSFQQSLKLKKEDVEQIEQPLIALKESEYQQRLEAQRLKREEVGRVRQESVSSSQPVVTYVASPSTTTTSSYSSTKYQSSIPKPKSPSTYLLQKNRLLIGGGIATVLALILTFSFLDRTSQPKQNGNTQPNVSGQKSPTNSQMTAEDFFNRGLDKHNKGDNQGAIEDYTQAIKINQNWGKFSGTYRGIISAYYNRGLAHSYQKENQKAIADYTKAIELQPDDADAYYKRGNAHYELKEYQKAIADYTKAIELKPDYAFAYNNRGFALSYLKENQKAIADYNKAIELKPDYTLAYNNRGYAYYELKDYQKAIADYNKAIEFKSDYAFAYNNRGLAHYNLKDYTKAIADYTKAIEFQPDYALAYDNRGFSHYNLKEYQKAIADYTKAIELQPDYMIKRWSIL